MAGREIALFLKCPGSLAVQRLRHSFLECIVEYKSGSRLELQTKTPGELRTEFQLSATASLVDDEIVIHFQSRCTGIHTARIFAHTRELCRPIAFRVTENGTVESIPANRPVAVAEPPPPMQRLTASQHSVNEPRLQPSSQAGSPPRSPASAAESESMPARVRASPRGGTLGGAFSESKLSSRRGSTSSARSRSPSTYEPYSGDLISSTPGVYSFSDLYVMKQKGVSMELGLKVIDHASVITADAFKLINRGVSNKVAKQLGKKIQCNICSQSVKPSKTISLMQTEYCEPCFRRQFMLRSVTDHFMVPRVEYCGVEVPVNKKASKFVTAMMIIPQVNLRGLDFVDVRTAQNEFTKFSIENDGWIDKHLVLPLLKPCLLTQHFSEAEVKNTLCSQALTSLIHSYGMVRRGLVHEIEFLSLLAYAAREAQSFKAIDSAGSKPKFTRADLETAYAYRKELIMKNRSLRDSSHHGKSDSESPSHEHTSAKHGSLTKKPPKSIKKSASYDQELSVGSTPTTEASPPTNQRQEVPSPHSATPPHLAAKQGQVMLQGLTDPVVRRKAPSPSPAVNPANKFKFPSPNAVAVFPVQSNGIGEASSVQIPKRLFERRRQSSNASNLEPLVSHGENSLPEAEQELSLPNTLQHVTISPSSKPKNKNEEFKLTHSSADGWMMY